MATPAVVFSDDPVPVRASGPNSRAVSCIVIGFAMLMLRLVVEVTTVEGPTGGATDATDVDAPTRTVATPSKASKPKTSRPRPVAVTTSAMTTTATPAVGSWQCAPQQGTSAVDRRPEAYEANKEHVFPLSGAAVKGQCCGAVRGDIDHGWTLQHHMQRLMCGADEPEGAAQARGRFHRLRVLQIGANSGDNANDHLVGLLKRGMAEAVVVEPVPWLFHILSTRTYVGVPGVTPLRVAVGSVDGNISFMAPREGAGNWDPQMGGIQLPPKTVKLCKKRKNGCPMEKIQVEGVTFTTLLQRSGWASKEQQAGGIVLPDVIVIDTEGADGIIMTALLDTMEQLPGPPPATSTDISADDVAERQPAESPARRSKTEKKGRQPRHVAPGRPSVQPWIIQYEWKHLDAESNTALKERLRKMGYCVASVHYDVVAVRPSVDQCHTGWTIRGSR